MEHISKDLLAFLTQLLPGFVAAWVIYGLTSFPKPVQFERVVQALIYSLLIKAFVLIEERALTFLGKYLVLGIWDQDTELVASAISAVLFGLVFAYFANNDKVYAFARDRGLTKRTAYPSEWYGAFSEHPRYVVLHIDGSRRLSGYPVQWPSEPTIGHFKLTDAAWLNDDGSETALDSDHSVLIPAQRVEMVEFLKYVEELKNVTENTEPVAAKAA